MISLPESMNDQSHTMQPTVKETQVIDPHGCILDVGYVFYSKDQRRIFVN